MPILLINEDNWGKFWERQIVSARKSRGWHKCEDCGWHFEKGELYCESKFVKRESRFGSGHKSYIHRKCYNCTAGSWMRNLMDEYMEKHHIKPVVQTPELRLKNDILSLIAIYETEGHTYPTYSDIQYVLEKYNSKLSISECFEKLKNQKLIRCDKDGRCWVV